MFENEAGAIFLSTWLHSELIIAIHPALKLEIIMRKLKTLCERRRLKFQRIARGKLGALEIVGRNMAGTISKAFGIQAQQMRLGGGSSAMHSGCCTTGQFFSVSDLRLYELDRTSLSPDKGNRYLLF